MTLKPSLKAFALLTLLSIAAAPASAAATNRVPVAPSAWEAAWRWVVELFVPGSLGALPNASCWTDSGGRTTCSANALTDLDHGCTIDPEGHPNCRQLPS